jgi:hypothetical protein
MDESEATSSLEAVPGAGTSDAGLAVEDQGPTRRKTRGKQLKIEQYSDSDEEEFAPKSKRAKAAGKKAAVAKPVQATNPSSRSNSKKTASTMDVTIENAAIPVAEIPGTSVEATSTKVGSSLGDSMSQYQGIPLEELRGYLTPQDYVKVSIMRSLAESTHTGSEKNVTRKIHPDLAPSQVFLNWELELRAMVSTWVELFIIPQSCLTLLEAEATRYLRNMLKDLTEVVQEHAEQGTINERTQKPLCYSNQAQRIDLNAIRVTDVEKSLESHLPNLVPESRPIIPQPPPSNDKVTLEGDFSRDIAEKSTDDEISDEEYVYQPITPPDSENVAKMAQKMLILVAQSMP